MQINGNSPVHGNYHYGDTPTSAASQLDTMMKDYTGYCELHNFKTYDQMDFKAQTKEAKIRAFVDKNIDKIKKEILAKHPEMRPDDANLNKLITDAEKPDTSIVPGEQPHSRYQGIEGLLYLALG